MADVTLDKVDHKIIRVLLEDGRAPFSKIAKEVALTDVAIKKRLERLKRKGVVNSITADLNLKVLGYENPIYVQLRSEIGKNKDLVKRLREMDFIMELNQVIGEYNFIAKLVVPDLDSAEKFIERLGALDGIIDIKTSMVLRELKKTNSLPAHSLQNSL
ncbi:MAG: Lrp/AsnC family transcriptional regulator [Candidatus Diapherotrites archaeon]|nr:Lrp/AsnC family transcriptional regulator [Candidatus Micrarchaeota archaeon]MBU1939279.1 Lrp/AsnC family transcriptional regulator [Candidatus Micrarchaeota archaeon]